MRHRLVAATRQLVVPERLSIQHSEVLPAFGRDVDVSATAERGGRDPEHFLFQNPFYQGLWWRCQSRLMMMIMELGSGS